MNNRIKYCRMVAALVLFGVLCMPFASRAQSRVPSGYTLAIIGGQEFLMQSAYIWNPARRASGRKTALNIYAYLPDLSPAGPENLDIRSAPGSIITHAYSLHLSEDEYSVEGIVRNLIRMLPDCNYSMINRAQDGLQRIQCEIKDYSERFAYVEDGNIKILIRCNLPHTAPLQGCDAGVDYGKGLSVQIGFHAPRLHEVIRIRDDVFRLLDSFRDAAAAYRNKVGDAFRRPT